MIACRICCEKTRNFSKLDIDCSKFLQTQFSNKFAEMDLFGNFYQSFSAVENKILTACQKHVWELEYWGSNVFRNWNIEAQMFWELEYWKIGSKQ